jgi:hypothetical protein
MNKDFMNQVKEFFVSKTFTAIATILIGYFFGEEAVKAFMPGIGYAQELVTTGITGAGALALYAHARRVKNKAKEKKELESTRRTLNKEREEFQEKVNGLHERVQTLEARTPKRGDGGKFEPRAKSKPK